MSNLPLKNLSVIALSYTLKNYDTFLDESGLIIYFFTESYKSVFS